ncbi:LptF/LptG family permease [Thalassoglobus polymorphus]|uniref:LptF/LptG family permease n=1 Tax=Thalassoglobus polymorphus TaxID=2527994 RepID=UPI0018D25C3E|nr:LptF/LptG family permease [Thalassoglobus polymorphus]
MTTFDRYLLVRYLQTVAVFFCASAGLFVVVDGFVNLDSFQHSAEKAGGGTTMLFQLMIDHYFYQSLMIIELAGPAIVVISAIAALASFLKNGEFHPVLAAGVPTYRATISLLLGMCVVNGFLIVNQEVILPNVASKLQRRHGQTADDGHKVDPQFDPRWKMFVSGEEVFPAEKRLHKPQFRLPPVISPNQDSISAEDAYYLPPTSNEPQGGWLLKGITTSFEELSLSDTGKKVIVPQPNGTDVFVNCHLTFSQMSRHTSNHSLMGTGTLFQRLQEPYGSVLSRRSLLMHLHSRLTRPLLTIVGLYIVIPLIIRRDKMSNMQQVTNIAVCMLVLGIVYGISMGSGFLGQSGIVRTEQAAWAPLIFGSAFATWLSGLVRT